MLNLGKDERSCSVRHTKLEKHLSCIYLMHLAQNSLFTQVYVCVRHPNYVD